MESSAFDSNAHLDVSRSPSLDTSNEMPYSSDACQMDSKRAAGGLIGQEDDDLDASDYARHHQLTRDHMLESPWKEAPYPPRPQSMRSDSIEHPPLLSFEALACVGALGDSIRERWDVDQETAKYLMSIINHDHNLCTLTDEEFYSPPGLAHFKLEEPLLSSDPVLELADLKERNAAKLDARSLAPFELAGRDTDNNSTSWELVDSINQAVVEEKLAVEAGTIKYLQQIVRFPEPDDDGTSYVREKV
jgi:hypothetical protein